MQRCGRKEQRWKKSTGCSNRRKKPCEDTIQNKRKDVAKKEIDRLCSPRIKQMIRQKLIRRMLKSKESLS